MTTVGDVHDDTAVNAVVDVGVAPLLFFLPLPLPCPAAFFCGSACPPAALPPAVFLPAFFLPVAMPASALSARRIPTAASISALDATPPFLRATTLAACAATLSAAEAVAGTALASALAFAVPCCCCCCCCCCFFFFSAASCCWAAARVRLSTRSRSAAWSRSSRAMAVACPSRALARAAMRATRLASTRAWHARMRSTISFFASAEGKEQGGRVLGDGEIGSGERILVSRGEGAEGGEGGVGRCGRVDEWTSGRRF